MKVLVTGATGFIGRHVVPQLLMRGHFVTANARDEAKARSFDWFGRVSFVACDVHRPLGNPSEAFGHPDAVMHLAWPRLPNYKALFHYEETFPAHYRFLKSLVEAGIGQLLVTGTCLEYGMQHGALNESAMTAPVNPYALAKDTLHKCLQSLRRDQPFILQWARLFYLYGPGQNPNSLLAQLDRAIDNGETTFNMSGGDQLRDYLPVEGAAMRLISLLEHPECSGAINICTGEPISVRTFVEQHIAKRGAKIQLNLGHHPYPDYEPMAFWGDARKYSRHCQNA